MIEVFLERATQLALARDLIRDDRSYSAATALLSVHTAIAMNDALLLGLTGKRSRSADHSRAIAETQRACVVKKIDIRGLRHLRSLLSRKTDVSYGDDSVSFEAASSLANTSERFQEWAYSILVVVERSS
jgi:hypothetical protein